MNDDRHWIPDMNTTCIIQWFSTISLKSTLELLFVVRTWKTKTLNRSPKYNKSICFMIIFQYKKQNIQDSHLNLPDLGLNIQDLHLFLPDFTGFWPTFGWFWEDFDKFWNFYTDLEHHPFRLKRTTHTS